MWLCLRPLQYDWVSGLSRLFATENITVGPTERVSVASLSYFKNLSAVYSSVANPRYKESLTFMVVSDNMY